MTLNLFKHAALLACILISVGYQQAWADHPVRFTARILQEYPHDPQAFTQGLAWYQGKVYEGTGLYGHSSLRRVDLETGKVEQQLNHPEHIFAEGVTVFQDSIYQLTWQNKRIFQYKQEDFSLIRSWPYPREGWGLTHDTQHLILSDGSATLYFLDPKDLSEQRRITVREGKRKITQLNELEYIDGTIYANVWKSTKIALIDPQEGQVYGWLDLTELCQRMQKPTYHGEDSLNGIMYDSEGERLFVTGKLWPLLFEIVLVPAGS